MKDYLTNRTKAMKWVNNPRRRFQDGIAILEDAGFKPGVVSVLHRTGAGFRQSDERLMYHMRDFIKAFGNADACQDTDFTLNVVDGEVRGEQGLENSETKTRKKKRRVVPVEELSMLSNAVRDKLASNEYPERIAAVIHEYREKYVEREMLFRQMGELPESNDEDTVAKRKRLSDKMNILSDRMDVLYPQYAAYIKDGALPEDESEKVQAEEEKPAEDSASDLSALTKEQLQKMRRSVATKILRARNMLLYQAETKQPQENPLTDEVKITKYNAKIERLSAELREIDLAVAKFG